MIGKKIKNLIQYLPIEDIKIVTSEILKISKFAKGMYLRQKNEEVISFLISLDFLVKGVLSHW